MNTPEWIIKLLEISDKEIYFNKGAYIFRKDETANELYCLLGGRVKLWNPGEVFNRGLTYYLVYPPELFGFLEFFAGQSKRRFSAIAIDKDVVVRRISIEKFKKFLEQNPLESQEILKILIKNAETNWQKYAELQMENSIQEKVWRTLYGLATEKGERVENGLRIKAFNHQDLADNIGISRQSVTTVLNELRRQNKLDYNRQYYVLKD